jgi:O-antigen ligase
MYKTRPPMWRLVIQDVHNHPLIGHGLDSFRLGNIAYFKNSFNDQSYRAFKREDGAFMIPHEAEKEVKEKIASGKNPLDIWDNAHNTFIHYTYEAGMLFPVIIGYFCFVIYSLFKRSKRSKETVALTAAIITFLISSLVQFPFSLARIAHAFPILLAMFYISVKDDVD